MKKSGIAMGILSMAFLASCTKDVKETGELTINQSLESDQLGIATAARQGGVSNVPNELLIKFKRGTSETGRANALARISGKVQEHILTNAMKNLGDEGVYLVHTPLNALEAIAKAKGLEVEFAEPNWVYTHSATSTDTYFADGRLWGMHGEFTSKPNQYGSNAAAAWAAGRTGSSNVYVGIIDEGFQNTHTELDANSWKNPHDPVDGIDNDKNGYIDDINGWDFDGNNNSIYDGGKSGGSDDHGTHVAGTIGGESNGSGVAGVNWNITMISGKFLGRRGGTSANAVRAVDYFTDLKTRHGLNIVATNNSWGGGGYSQALYDAISRANNAGILFIAAAGNGGSDGVGDDNDKVASYPSNYNLPNVIAVASITSTGAISPFSNFGKTTVDIGAPGSGIISSTAFNTYSSYSGTSMATPHVTGAAALYAATKNLSPKTANDAAIIRTAILSSAVPTASLANNTVTGGRLDVNAALSK